MVWKGRHEGKRYGTSEGNCYCVCAYKWLGRHEGEKCDSLIRWEGTTRERNRDSKNVGAFCVYNGWEGTKVSEAIAPAIIYIVHLKSDRKARKVSLGGVPSHYSQLHSNSPPKHQSHITLIS